MGTTEIFLIAMAVIFTLPWLVWRVLRTDYWAPLVVVQIVMGIVLGPGILGAVQPEVHAFVFRPEVVQALNGIAWWAVLLFVWLAGIELDWHLAWRDRRESAITAGLALGVPMLLGCAAGALLLASGSGWIGGQASAWQFTVGIGMACAVTALPVLVLLLDKLGILREPLGQRVLRYASLDDIVIWAVLALLLLDTGRMARQAVFVVAFAGVAWTFRRLMMRLVEADRWPVALIWLLACSLAADWAGLHYMVGAFLAGVVMDASWFDRTRLESLRHHVLMIAMPVYFLSTGLRTQWEVGGVAVLAAACLLLVASVAGKLLGLRIAGRLLGWGRHEAWVIGWLLQTKALVMIVFANVMLDKDLITSGTFTALLLMAVASTMLTIPMVNPRLATLAGKA